MVVKKSTLIVAVVAFCAGAGVSWLAMDWRAAGTRAANPPPTYIISPSGDAPTAAAAVPPPDVSQQSPGEAAVTLGNWNYDQKNWAKAVESYRRAISLGADTADIRTDLGNALRFTGEPRQALEEYQTAQHKNPQHENSLYNMATLYAAELHDPAAAARAMQEYLARFPNGDKASIAKQFLEQPGTGK